MKKLIGLALALMVWNGVEAAGTYPAAPAVAVENLATAPEPEDDSFRFGLGLAHYGGPGFLASMLFQIDSVHSIQSGMHIGAASRPSGLATLAISAHYRARVLFLEAGGFTAGLLTTLSFPGRGLGVMPTVGGYYDALSNLTFAMDIGPTLTAGRLGLGVGASAHVLL